MPSRPPCHDNANSTVMDTYRTLHAYATRNSTHNRGWLLRLHTAQLAKFLPSPSSSRHAPACSCGSLIFKWLAPPAPTAAFLGGGGGGLRGKAACAAHSPITPPCCCGRSLIKQRLCELEPSRGAARAIAGGVKKAEHGSMAAASSVSLMTLFITATSMATLKCHVTNAPYIVDTYRTYRTQALGVAQVMMRVLRPVMLLTLAVLGEVRCAQEHFRWLKRSECTSGMPQALRVFGIDDICADMELEGCSEVVRVGLRFAHEEQAMVTEEISTGGGASACASSAELGPSALNQACGDSWRICVSFASLQIGRNHLAGCPTIQVALPLFLLWYRCDFQAGTCRNICGKKHLWGARSTASVSVALPGRVVPVTLLGCRFPVMLTLLYLLQVKDCQLPWPPGAAPIPSFDLPLDCFDSGFECSRETDCDKCIENGCGWCAADEFAGNTGTGKCLEGNSWGPICDECGSNCSCSWNYGKCPMKKADMSLIAREMSVHAQALANVSSQLHDTFDDVSHGHKLEVRRGCDGRESIYILAAARPCAGALSVGVRWRRVVNPELPCATVSLPNQGGFAIFSFFFEMLQLEKKWEHGVFEDSPWCGRDPVARVTSGLKALRRRAT